MRKVLSVVLLVTMLLSSFSFTALAAEEIVITTADSGCKMEGAWKESTSEKVAGPTGGTSWYTADLASTVTYDASDLDKGNYGVYVYMTPYASTADKMDVTITASGKATKLTVDGFHGGAGNRHWLFLGKFDFDGSSDDGVTTQINPNAGLVGGNGQPSMRTSGVKFVKDDTNTAAVETVDGNTASANPPATTPAAPTTPAPSTPAASGKIDNTGIVYTTNDTQCKLDGAWKESTAEGVAGPTGGTSWYARDTESTATFDASDLDEGNYGVYVFVTPWGASPDKVDVTITASEKASVVTINGADGGSGNRHWVFVGKYDFDGSSDDNVKIQMNSASTEGSVRVSGVKFVKDDPNTATVNSADAPSAPTKEIEYTTIPEVGSVLMGSEHPGFSTKGSWKQSSLAMPVPDKAYYARGKSDAATLYPYINKAENVEIFVNKPRISDTEDSATQIKVFAGGEEKVTEVNFQVPPTGWYSLGRYNFSGDGSEYIQVTKGSDVAEHTVRFTCFKFAIVDDEPQETQYVSAFYGTDLHMLERMGMLIGEGDGITADYLKKVPTRVQAAIMILRLNGLDSIAAAFTGTDNFADASLEAWAMPYLAYLKAHPELGLIGTGDNMFEPTANIDAQAYAKILLTALGYEYDVDFTWDQTLAFAKEKGITVPEGTEFTVNDLAVMTESIMDLNCKDGSSYFTKLIAGRDGVDKEVYGYELPADMKAARDESRAKKRFIYNNDGNDVYKSYPEYPLAYDISHLDGNTINAENFLKARTYGLENTQVTTVTYNTGVFNSCHHESTGITDVRVRDWARALKEYTGKDSLQTMIDYVHSVGRECFFSARVNDTHDLSYQEDQLDPWKMANKDKLMFATKAESTQQMSYGANRWTAADYTHYEVRKLIYDMYKDVLDRYDVDGIEIDFTRHPLYFKEVVCGQDVYPENLERMTNLIRTLRDYTEKKSVEVGKPILISILVPDSIDFCKAIGLDVATWCEEGLIDIVAIGSSHPGAFQTWTTSIAEYDAYDVAVHANLDPNTYADNTGMTNDEITQKEAAWAYHAGADGISMYNQFKINAATYDTLGTPETAGAYDPNYKTVRVKGSAKFVKDQDKYRKPLQ